MMPLKTTRLTLYARIFDYIYSRGWTLTGAESLTAGLAMADFVSLSGASGIVKEAFITYSDEAKEDLLGVSANSLKEQGAVSQEVALQMAQGACQKASAQVSIALTGVAGPGPLQAPNGENLPAGMVWIAVCVEGQAFAKRLTLHGSRDAIRRQAVWEAWQFLAQTLEI